MTHIPPRRTLIYTASIAILLALAAVYFLIDPSQTPWMPKCPSKWITGYDCPGCGSQRAIHALLHGRFSQAWHFNPFLILALPYLALVCWGACPSLPASTRIRRITYSPTATGIYIAIFLAWWVIRNL